MHELVVDLAIVSTVLLWEILHFMGLNSWNNNHFNLDICIKSIENSKHLGLFLNRIIGELTKIMNDKDNVILNARYTVVVYKIFAFFIIIIEKSTTRVLKNYLRNNFQEEFK